MSLPKADSKKLSFRTYNSGMQDFIDLPLTVIGSHYLAISRVLTRLVTADLFKLNHVVNQAFPCARRYSFFATAPFNASCTKLKLARIRFKPLSSSSRSLSFLGA